jgi:predicted deacylase
MELTDFLLNFGIVMKRRFTIPFFIFLFAVCNSVFGQGSWRPGEMEIKVQVRNQEEAMTLHNLNLNGDIYLHSGYALLYVTPAELELVMAEAFDFEILKNDLNLYFRDFWKTRDQYHSYDEIIDVIDSLSTTYPSFCKKFDYGLSVEGRQLCALKISDNVNADEPEPEVMFDGGIHGDEVGGPENLVRFAEQLCDDYNIDPEITELINSREIWLYIMINPDGRVNMIRYNSNGVDLNRDWGYMWNGEGSSPDYFSQVETRALRTCSQSNQFALQITYHSGTVFLAYPWSYSPNPCPDQAQIQQLGNLYAAASGYDYLPVEPGYTGMYEISGSSKDANYGSMGSVSWTMEISTNKQPPASQIQYYYDINEPAMITMLEYAGYGISGTVTDANLGIPVAATIYVNDYVPCYSDPVIGDYHKYLLAGEYTVTAVANGYQPMTQTVTVAENETSTLDFSLEQHYNQFAYRVIGCRRPIANFEDEARTSAALWAPDSVNYSLGRFGWIILDMQDEILDGPGNEITVYEGDSDPEGYACFAAEEMDGPWQLVGNGTGTTTFNLGASGLTTARYIRIEDDGDGLIYGDNAGFDLDAVEIPEQPEIIYLVMNCYIDDPSGNGNHRIDPGENFDLVITLSNFGNLLMEGGQAYLNIDPEFISVSNPEQDIANLDYGESTQLVFNMNCSFICLPEEILMTVLNINSNQGSFQQSFPINFTAGAIIEDWETVSFNKFDWSTGGNHTWAISFLEPYEGVCSAKSGNIDDGELSYLQVTMDVIGYDDISFYRKISSEPGSDYLVFYIDNNIIGQWSGEFGWEQESYQVSPGIHTFKWSYQKNNQNSQNADGAWIDYIKFPSCNLDGKLKALANANPHEFCGAFESQLGAYITGGGASLSFSWEPAGSLDNPLSQFPLANIETSTLFSVEVTDGVKSTTSTILVNSFEIPETPVITQEGDSLISGTAIGNQWYNNTGAIPGATGQVFYPGAENDYYVVVSNENDCQSEPSNIVHFIFTGILDKNVTENIFIYPNPVKEAINIYFTKHQVKKISIRITDITGNEISTYNYDKVDLQDIIRIPAYGLKNSLYLLSVIDHQGRIIFSQKIAKQ